MNDVERKLAKYRAQKEREVKFNKFKMNIKNKLTSYFTSGETSRDNKESTECLLRPELERPEHFTETIKDNLSDLDSLSTEDEDSITANCCSYVDCLYYLLCFILWVTVYIIFIKLQFGTVYLIISGLIGIYLNTRTGPKTKDEVSAYSVFNKDCKSIDGTLKAEQFEREIRYGPSVIQ